MSNILDPDDVRVGRLVNYSDDTVPDQAATLRFNERRGAELLVPYFEDYEETDSNPQYRRTDKWFDWNHPQLPKTLVFEDNRGWVTLVGARVAGTSGANRLIGRVVAEAAIFERPREYKTTYLCNEFISTIDGLQDFAQFTPIQLQHESHEEPARIVTTVTIDTYESVDWEFNGFRYTLQSNVDWNAVDGREFNTRDSSPYLSTISESGATLTDHLLAQRSVRALLSLVYGRRISWRSHKVRDDQFPLWMLDGSDAGAHSVDVLVSRSVEQHRDPKPERGDFIFAMFRLLDIGTNGMVKWTELFSDESFMQAVQPAVEVINGASRFLEPQLMTLAISLDRFGYYRFGDQKRRSMPDHITKCLEAANLDFPQIGSVEGIAKAISNVNNDLKHPDREKYPGAVVLSGVKELAKIIVRAQLFDLLDAPDQRKTEFLAANDVQNVIGIFEQAKLTVNDAGEFVRPDGNNTGTAS